MDQLGGHFGTQNEAEDTKEELSDEMCVLLGKQSLKSHVGSFHPPWGSQSPDTWASRWWCPTA